MGNNQGYEILQKLSITPGNMIGTKEFDTIWYSIKAGDKNLSHKKALMLLKKLAFATSTNWDKTSAKRLIREIGADNCLNYYQMKILFVYSIREVVAERLSTSLQMMCDFDSVDDAVQNYASVEHEEVYLNIYDLDEAVGVNSSGIGAFHTGITLFGSEWSFSVNLGIFRSDIQDSPIGKFRKSIKIGNTLLRSESEVLDYLQSVLNDWTPESYDLVSHNCNHFCNMVSMHLVGKKIPRSVRRLGHIAKNLKFLIPDSVRKPKANDKSSDSFEFEYEDESNTTTTTTDPSDLDFDMIFGEEFHVNMIGDPMPCRKSSNPDLMLFDDAYKSPFFLDDIDFELSHKQVRRVGSNGFLNQFSSSPTVDLIC